MVRWQTWQAQRFKIFESARHCRIASGRLIRIQIESRSFAGPYSTFPPTRCVIKHLSMFVCTVGWIIAIHCWLELSSQNATARLVSGACCCSHVTPVLARLYWLPVYRGIVFKTAVLVQVSARCSSSVPARLVHVSHRQ